MNRKNKSVIIILVIVSLIITTTTFFALVAVFFFKSEQYETTEQSEYRNYSGHIEKEKDDLFSKLYIFPNEIANGVTINQYYYYGDNGALDNSYKYYI